MATRKAAEPRGGSILGSALTTVVLAPALAVVLLWLGLPGVAVVWLALVVRAMSAQPPELTGPRKDGRPTIGSDREQKQMDAYLRVVDIRDNCLDPTRVAPGWPVRLSWLVSIGVAALAWLVPQAWEATRWVNALLALMVVSAVAAAGRNGDRSEPSPGTRLDTLPTLVRAAPVKTALLAVCGGIAGVLAAVAGIAVCHLPAWAELRDRLLALDMSVEGLPELGPVPWPHAMATPPHTPGWQFVLVAAVLGAVAGISGAWQKLALAHWRSVVAAREEWAVRWPVVKADPAPRLVDRVEIESASGSVIVETFSCQAGFPAEKTIALSPQLRPTLGDDTVGLAMLPQPQTDPKTNAPMPGTSSTLAFRAVRWPGGLADIADPATTPELVELALESAMTWAAESTGWSRMLLASTDRITVEPGRGGPAADDPDGSDSADADDPAADTGPEPGSDRQAWAVQWTSPIGMEMVQVRLNLAGPMAGSLGCEVLVDHRAAGGRLLGQGVMYAGALTDGAAVFDAEAMPVPAQTDPAETLVNLSIEDWWVGVWGAVLGSEANPPTVKHNVRTVAVLPNGTEITTQPFTVRHGQTPRDFFGTEAKISSAMDSMSFVAVTGFPDRSTRRPGDRHPMAFQVHYAKQAVPGLTVLPPCETSAALPLLAGKVAAAFKAARLAQPEVYAVRCLTERTSRGHIWEATVRLFDGVTLAELRGRHKQLAIGLGVPWLRIVEHGNDCRIVAGVEPVGARMGERERGEVVGYDWEQVWRDARCTGVDGALPSVLSVKTLPSNPLVSELVFRIPNGLDVPRLKAARSKLSTASENGFVEVTPGPEPATVRLLVARADPMPTSAPYRFEMDSGEGRLAFADGVDGEPVVMDLAVIAHLMLTGTSGGGKTTAGLTLLQGALAVGAEVAVIDVQKGCADFRYAEPWCMAMTGDLMDAAATMSALYAEVGRRRDLNAQYGVGSVRELPDDIRPPEVFVFVDEFFGLISSPDKPSTKPESNPDLEAARLEALAAYNAKARIAYVTGRIGAEARSAGFHLVLMTQALSSKMKLPSSIADLKLNSNRVLLGKATHGDRTSALRQPESAPGPGEVMPRGRAVYEPVTGEARLVQFWYAPTDDYAAWLEDNVEKVTPEELLDIEPYRMDDTAGAAFVVTDEGDSAPAGPAGPAGARVLEDEDAGAVPPEFHGLVVESSVELFDEFDLPELAEDDTVDWSLVVGMDRSTDDNPLGGSEPIPEGVQDEPDDPAPSVTRSEDEDDWFGGGDVMGVPGTQASPDEDDDDSWGWPEGDPEPASGTMSASDFDEPDEDKWDDEWGEPDLEVDAGDGAKPPLLPVRPITPTRAVVTGFDDEDDNTTAPHRPVRPAPARPTPGDGEEEGFGDFGPPARRPARAAAPEPEPEPESAADGVPVDEAPPVPGSLANPLAGLRRR